VCNIDLGAVHAQFQEPIDFSCLQRANSIGGRNGSNLTFDEYSIRKLPLSVARAFISNLHYSGGCAVGSMTWGLFDNPTNELLGAIAFHTPISENVRNSIFGDGICENCDHINNEHKHKEHVTELHRLVTKEKCPKNTETWFISRGLDLLKSYKPKYRAVVSFADSTEGHLGKIYQASNAIYYGTSGKSTFYRDQDDVLRPPRNGGDNISVEEARSRGWSVDRREAKHRYLFLLPDQYQSKGELYEMLEIEEQEYPAHEFES